MEFLKAILGDELYNQFVEKLNNYNGDEANKDKQIKLANLAGGEYVGKGKYDALQEQLDGKTNELTTANGLIDELKKGTKGNEQLQGKITAYEGEGSPPRVRGIVISLVDWKKTHTTGGAAMELHMSERTARSQRNRFIYAVAKNMRYL